MRRRRVLLAGAYGLFLLLLLETASRVYWWGASDVPALGSRRDWYGIFYQHVRESGVFEADLRPDDGTFDVLLLGGSVLHFLYENRGDELRDRLRAMTGRDVRIFDLARVAHTTRDSLLKYRLLEDKRFDLVVVYHGINDVRMNNSPPEHYRADYSHASWYAKLGALEAGSRLAPWLTLPFSLAYARVAALEASGLRSYVPRHYPRPGWTGHGAQVRTGDAFRDNLRALLGTARRRGDPVLLMTFAWYLPEDYSLERYLAHELDYEGVERAGRPVPRRHPVELWGVPDFVARGLRVHNAVLRGFGAEPGVLFVETALAIPARGAFFFDICHLTPRGEERWMASFLSAVQAFLAAPPPGGGATPRSPGSAGSRGSPRRGPPRSRRGRAR